MAVWWVWIYTSWVTNWLDPAALAPGGSPVALLSAVALTLFVVAALETRYAPMNSLV